MTSHLFKKILVGSLALCSLPQSAYLKEPATPAKSGATPESPQRPNAYLTNDEWKRWKQRFASASPLLTLNKTWPKPLNISDENINLVLQRKSLISFPQTLRLGDKSLTSIDLSEFDTALRFEPSDQIDLQLDGVDPNQALKEEERFKKMVVYMAEMIGKRTPDELLIQFVGATHGVDLYFDFFLKDSDKRKIQPFLARQNEVVFFAAPYTMETTRYTKEYQEFEDVVDGTPSKPKTFGDGGVLRASMFLSRLYLYQNLLREKLKLADLKRDEAFLGTIVLLDIHSYNETAHIDSLPSASALKNLGFTKVKLGNEGWKFGQNYSLDQLRRSAMTPAQGKLLDYDETLIKERKPKWYERYQEGIIVDPATYALYRKLKSWADAGISVSITGLEEFENIGK
jgi:hypothetical protein